MEDMYYTQAAVPPVHCHIRPAFLGTLYPVEMGIPFPEIEIQSRIWGKQLRLSKSLLKVVNKRSKEEIKEGDASEGTQRGGLLQSFTFN